MDELLDTVAPLTLFNKNSSVSEVNIDQLKDLVKLLISHVITFKNLALGDDQKSLTEMCQKVNIKHNETFIYNSDTFIKLGFFGMEII